MTFLLLAEYIFTFCFVGTLFACAMIGAFAAIHIFVLFIRMFPGWEKFLQAYQTPEPEKEEKPAPHVVKRVALDFLIQRSQEERGVNLRRAHALLKRPATAGLKNDAVEFSLEELRSVIARPLQKSEAERTDLWSLVKYPHGLNHPYYLISKLSQKGRGLRTAFSPSPLHKLTMDRDSAVRWAAVLGEGVFWIPANAEARMILRGLRALNTEETQREEAQREEVPA
jgi:hypothetical protein